MERAVLEQQKTNPKDLSGWPDDWYVYDGERVRGPLSAKEAFAPPNPTTSGPKPMVSRKGFSQWYDLRDLSAIFNLTTSMGRRVEAERARLEKSPQSMGVPKRAPLHPAPSMDGHGPSSPMAARSRPSAARAMPPQPLARGHLGLGLSNSLAKPVAPADGSLSERQVSALPLQLSPADVDFTPPDGLQPSHVGDAKTSQVGSHQKNPKPETDWMRDYIYAKAQLRLGEIRQPWVTGMLAMPLTLGGYWVVWFRDFSREIAAHGSTKLAARSDPFWWSALPLLHMVATYRLAAKMRMLEGENRYASTVPWLAALLSVFPPLAAVYLQSAANKHWRLHVRHVKATSPTPEPSS